MYRRNRLTAGLAAVTVAFALGACDEASSPSTSDPEFVNDARQVGLVNVSTGDIDLLNNVNLAVAANVIATVCDVTIPVAVLATQILADGSVTECESTTAPITIEQSGQPFTGPGGPGGNQARQEGLINVSLGDVAILNNVNIAVAANVVATVCDATVTVAILAEQLIADNTETFCTGTAREITVDQAQG
jgi:hypothetical protein